MRWKPVVGYEDDYSVSDCGEIWSVRSKRVLKKRVRGNGYLAVTLSVNCVRKDFYVHDVVARAFIGKKDGKVVNHIDGNKENNNLSNLEVVTQSENLKHAFANNLNRQKKGAENEKFKGVIYAENLETGDVIELSGKVDISSNGFEPSSVYGCVNGRLKAHKGYKFRRI